jgi:hypothetical protein
LGTLRTGSTSSALRTSRTLNSLLTTQTTLNHLNDVSDLLNHFYNGVGWLDNLNDFRH